MKTIQIHIMRAAIFSLAVLVFPFSSSFALPTYCGDDGLGGHVKIVLDYARPNGLSNMDLLNMDVNKEVEGVMFTSAYSFGGDAVTQIGKMVTDDLGNTYITGGFTGTMILGSDTLVSTSGLDYYIVKLDSSNEPVWARMAHGTTIENENLSMDGGTVITIDGEGNLYTGGGFVKSLTFLDADGQAIQTLTDGRNDELYNLELFVAKYDNDGNLLWVEGGESGSIGSENSLAVGINSVNDITLDVDGFLYIVGRFSGTNFLGSEVESFGKGDAYVASLDIDGEEKYWVSTTGTPEEDVATSVSVDHLGYVNVLGSIGQGEMTLPDKYSWTNDTGRDDSFVMGYDALGEWFFASFMGAGERVVGNDIETSPDGDIYVTGFFQGDATFDGSDIELSVQGTVGDGFIAKYDLNSNAQWVAQFGGQIAEGQRIVLDEFDNVYVLGVYYDTVVFGADTEYPTVLTTSESLEANMFVAKYDTDGAFMWAKQIEGEGLQGIPAEYLNSEDFPFSVLPLDIQLSGTSEEEFLISGDFNSTISLDGLELASPDSARLGFVATLDVSGETVSINEGIVGNQPTDFSLMQNYPNPFNPSTTINFALPKADMVTLEVYDVKGRLVKTLINETRSAGNHQVQFDASNFASGTYMYRLSSSTGVETRKLTLIK